MVNTTVHNLVSKIMTDAPPRSPSEGPYQPREFFCQQMRGSFSWGTSPGCAVLTYVGDVPVSVGALVKIQLGRHFFAGLCISDVGMDSSRGGTRTLEFKDLRDFLTWDWVCGSFNRPFRQMIGKKWVKRYEHVLPENFDHRIRTFTNRPLLGWEILKFIFRSATIGSPWQYDLTGNGLFPRGLLNAPIFDLDFMTGVRLDSLLATICDKSGLVMGLDSKPYAPYRLVFMRKGYGLLPVFPDNSDDRRIGLALSGNPTNIRVLGDRNRYQILNLEMKPDWSPAWEQFLVVDDLAQDIFQNEKDPKSGLSYKNFPDDPEQWQGSLKAKIRALEITVAEYARLRDARKAGDGEQFRDYRKFAQRSRMDLPAAIYIQTLIFRAFRPVATTLTNFAGAAIPLDSVNIVGEMACRVTYDPLTGVMQDEPDEPSDGNGVAIVKGYQFGEDFFQLVKPERITADFFSNERHWAAAAFQVDDSGEGERYIIFENPIFTSENLLTEIDGQKVLNAGFKLDVPQVKCGLTFEMEQFSYWKGTWPNVSRDQVEFVSGLRREYTGTPGNYREVKYANGESAGVQADQIAREKLLCQYIYVSGGYNLKWKPTMPVSDFGTALGSLVDRCDIEIGTNGVMQLTDWTTERQRDNFEPERDLERKTMANTLAPGQAELRQQSYNYQRLLAGIQSTPRDVFNKFMNFLRGDFGEDSEVVRFDPAVTNPFPTGSVIAAGSVIFKSPTASVQGSPATGTLVIFPSNYDPDKHLVFAGATVRNNEDASKPFLVQKAGDVLALVQGPVKVNEPLGPPAVAGGNRYSTTGAYFNVLSAAGDAVIGVALQSIKTNAIKLIKVRLSAGASGDGDTWLP